VVNLIYIPVLASTGLILREDIWITKDVPNEIKLLLGYMHGLYYIYAQIN